MTIDVTGIGWVTAISAGCGRGRHAFAFSEGALPAIEQGQIFTSAYPSFRRMDEYSKCGIAAISFALKDAGLDRWSEKRNIGLICSTEYGCLVVDLDYYGTVLREEGIGASPALFAYTLPNSFLGDAAILFGLTGKAFVVNEPSPLGLNGLKLALDSLLLGECGQILCGVSNRKAPPPLDRYEKAMPGALFFVLENSPAGSASSYGTLSVEGCSIRFEKKELHDLSGLVRLCLAR